MSGAPGKPFIVREYAQACAFCGGPQWKVCTLCGKPICIHHVGARDVENDLTNCRRCAP